MWLSFGFEIKGASSVVAPACICDLTAANSIAAHGRCSEARPFYQNLTPVHACDCADIDVMGVNASWPFQASEDGKYGSVKGWRRLLKCSICLSLLQLQLEAPYVSEFTCLHSKTLRFCHA